MYKLLMAINNRIKIIMSDRIIWVLSFFLILFFGMVSTVLIRHTDYGSRMPIALVDEDESFFSTKLVNNIKLQDAIYVIHTNMGESQNLLRDGRVEAIYYIPSGYEERIQNLEVIDLIEVYYLEGSTAGKVISDVIAGEMLYDISLLKTLEILERSLNRKEFNPIDSILIRAIEKAEASKSKDNQGSVMTINLVNLMDDTTVDIDNTIIFQQVVIGIISIFLGFFILFTTNSIVKDKELGIELRLKTICNSIFIKLMTNILSLLLIGLTITSIMVIILLVHLDMEGLRISFYIMLLFISYVFAITSFFVMCSTFINRVITMQIFGSAILLIFAILGGSFWNIDFLNNPLTIINNIIPNHWFINGFTNMLINNNLNSTYFEYIRPLIVLGIGYFFLGFVVEKIKSIKPM